MPSFLFLFVGRDDTMYPTGIKCLVLLSPDSMRIYERFLDLTPFPLDTLLLVRFRLPNFSLLNLDFLAYFPPV